MSSPISHPIEIFPTNTSVNTLSNHVHTTHLRSRRDRVCEKIACVLMIFTVIGVSFSGAVGIAALKGDRLFQENTGPALIVSVAISGASFITASLIYTMCT